MLLWKVLATALKFPEYIALILDAKWNTASQGTHNFSMNLFKFEKLEAQVNFWDMEVANILTLIWVGGTGGSLRQLSCYCFE